MIVQNAIGWCDATANAVIGCRGCELGERCYARNDTPARVLRAGDWPGYRGRKVETFGPGSERVPVAGFAAKLRGLNALCLCDQCHQAQPFARVGQQCGQLPPRRRDSHVLVPEAFRLLADNECTGTLRRIRVFADSNSDWLDWPAAILARGLDAIRLAPNLDIILCTKWPENFHKKVEIDCRGWFQGHSSITQWIENWMIGKPPENITLLTSVTTAKTLRRADDLLKIPARRRGLSMEPLWENVSLPDEYLCRDGNCGHARFDWVIVGGESGREGRDCGATAIVNVVRQCVAAGVPVYVKQDRELKASQQGRIPDDIWKIKEFPTLRPA